MPNEDRPPRLACARGPEKGMREQREKSPQTGPPQRGTCPPQAGAGSVQGDILGRFPGMA